MRPVIDYEAAGKNIFAALDLLGQTGQVFLLLTTQGYEPVFWRCREGASLWQQAWHAGWAPRLQNVREYLDFWTLQQQEAKQALLLPEMYRQTWSYAAAPAASPHESLQRLLWIAAKTLRRIYNEIDLVCASWALTNTQHELVIPIQREAETLGPKRLRRLICRVEFERACGKPPPNKLVLDAFEAVWMTGNEDRARQLAREWAAERSET